MVGFKGKFPNGARKEVSENLVDPVLSTCPPASILRSGKIKMKAYHQNMYAKDMDGNQRILEHVPESYYGGPPTQGCWHKPSEQNRRQKAVSRRFNHQR